MKQYPSIHHLDSSLLGRSAVAFNKIDGSNLRFEWSKKRSWNKFGSRTQMISESHGQFGPAVKMFMNKYAYQLEKIFKDDKDLRNIQEFVVYCEYAGDKSCFGQHVEGDIMDLVLFDVSLYKKGFMGPKDFVRKFGELGIPEIIYDGLLTEEFVRSVKHSETLKEGAVVKGMENGRVWMTKLKTLKWLESLRLKEGDKAIEEEFHGSIANK